jgi:hypothetical protein
LINCKRLINSAKDNKKFNETIETEGKALLDSWLDDEFPGKLAGYMQYLLE